MLVCEEVLGRAIVTFFKEAKIPRPFDWSEEWDRLWLQFKAVPAFLAALKEIEDVQLCEDFDASCVYSFVVGAGDRQAGGVVLKMTTPRSECCREREDCQPWVFTVTDDKSSFICCGKSDPDTRSVPQDEFRLCFVTPDTDTRYDHDELDLLDLLDVISGALALARRVEDHE